MHEALVLNNNEYKIPRLIQGGGCLTVPYTSLPDQRNSNIPSVTVLITQDGSKRGRALTESASTTSSLREHG
jgi:hypothetical protein